MVLQTISPVRNKNIKILKTKKSYQVINNRKHKGEKYKEQLKKRRRFSGLIKKYQWTKK